jgi:hypothetical protein
MGHRFAVSAVFCCVTVRSTAKSLIRGHLLLLCNCVSYSEKYL